MLDSGQIEILRCPITERRLCMASEGVVAAVAQMLSKEASRAPRRDSAKNAPISAGLITMDGRLFYPIVGGIPKLLVEEAIELPEMGLEPSERNERNDE